ncbi:MAG: tRNA (N6-threonylcarbamoyladenosine(37)-N6)-methyltransferase TrmO [Chloroflexi bacterium]|nr:MAG: tRNA (N6-threonylcarbamoyladenosine(37)-N6)-methyltransferase TrmO [Chloroflexota bacterium]HDN80986.1 tRNA (N6-threonylcarbamoyladenosine(37)-N6)-methyltransferase TrmO [Chloroflexota bacterium]
MEIQLRPIGKVISPVKYPASKVKWSEIISTIEIDPQWEEGLEGVEYFSHLIVLYWFHLAGEKPLLKVHPRGDPSRPLRGVFSTRAPVRPNRIGVTVVKLLRRNGNRLEVQGLDAFDGTPVLDIKPYFPMEEDDGEAPPWVRGG